MTSRPWVRSIGKRMLPIRALRRQLSAQAHRLEAVEVNQQGTSEELLRTSEQLQGLTREIAAIRAQLDHARSHAESAADAALSAAIQHADAVARGSAEAVRAAAASHVEDAVLAERAVTQKLFADAEAVARREMGARLTARVDEALGVPVGHQPQPAVRAVLATFGVGEHSAFLDISRELRTEFCAVNEYELVESTAAIAGRPPAWWKVRMLQELLTEFDQVLWMDSDAIVVDPGSDPRSQYGAKGLPWQWVVHRYGGDSFPNMGVLLLRRHDAVLELLEQMWRRTEFIDHKWWENAAVLDLIGYATEEPIRKVRPSVHDSIIAELPQRWNVIPQAGGADIAVAHFAGYPNHVRRGCLAAIALDQSCAADALADPIGFAARRLDH
jgi:hypothetical protein